MMNEDEIMVPATVELTTSPEQVIKNGTEAVTTLMKLLDQKENPIIINKKRHIEFDDWIILGNFYGIDVRTGEAEPVEVFNVKGFKARAEVIRIDDGVVIGGAEAYCMSNERNWKNKPFFQLASMAQTRAGSKALSNVLRGFVALKGISGTPAEEMIRRDNTPKDPQNPKGKGRNTPPRPPKEPDNVVDGEVTVKEVNTDSVFADCPKGLQVAEQVRKDSLPLTNENIRAKARDMVGTNDITPEEKQEIFKKLVGK